MHYQANNCMSPRKTSIQSSLVSENPAERLSQLRMVLLGTKRILVKANVRGDARQRRGSYICLISEDSANTKQLRRVMVGTSRTLMIMMEGTGETLS
jgi:hypothetical protein